MLYTKSFFAICSMVLQKKDIASIINATGFRQTKILFKRIVFNFQQTDCEGFYSNKTQKVTFCFFYRTKPQQ
jgi:hypothetical protein